MSPVTIVDYGMGNIESVVNALQLLNVHCVVTDDAEKIKNASAVILPGVGAFHAAMENLRTQGLDDALQEAVVIKQKPFLGICLGLQLIAMSSTELQFSQGLGWIDGQVVRLEPHELFPVPHVGWNEVVYHPNSILFNQIEENAHFFFDHSYHLQCNSEIIAAHCEYGKVRVASIEKEHIFAVQFHPEKSQRNGLKLLRNFLNFAHSC